MEPAHRIVFAVTWLCCSTVFAVNSPLNQKVCLKSLAHLNFYYLALDKIQKPISFGQTYTLQIVKTEDLQELTALTESAGNIFHMSENPAVIKELTRTLAKRDETGLVAHGENVSVIQGIYDGSKLISHIQNQLNIS